LMSSYLIDGIFDFTPKPLVAARFLAR
jgi:hypothetical protein